MKKIKKLLSVFIVGLVVAVGGTQLSTVQASACEPPFCPLISVTMDTYEGQLLSLAMQLQYSDYVYNIQWLLNQLGFDECTPNGYYDPGTFVAVLHFQEYHGLYKDGRVGLSTWDELHSHCFY